MNENDDLEIIEDLDTNMNVDSNLTTVQPVSPVPLEEHSSVVVPDIEPELIDIDENNKKPEIMKEQVVTEKEQEKKQNKAGMTLVVVILLILILVVLFLPQISSMLS